MRRTTSSIVRIAVTGRSRSIACTWARMGLANGIGSPSVRITRIPAPQPVCGVATSTRTSRSWVPIGERLQQHRPDHGEHRRIRSDAQSQGKHGGDSEGRIPAQGS